MSTNLNKDKQVLVDSLKKAKNLKGLSNFIDDLWTEEEILDLSQRLKIAKLIIEGKNYDEISEKVKTSTSTVSKIGQIIKYGKGSFEKIFRKKKTKGDLPHEALAKGGGKRI